MSGSWSSPDVLLSSQSLADEISPPRFLAIPPIIQRSATNTDTNRIAEGTNVPSSCTETLAETVRRKRTRIATVIRIVEMKTFEQPAFLKQLPEAKSQITISERIALIRLSRNLLPVTLVIVEGSPHAVPSYQISYLRFYFIRISYYTHMGCSPM